jgi:hypothetical protein
MQDPFGDRIEERALRLGTIKPGDKEEKFSFVDRDECRPRERSLNPIEGGVKPRGQRGPILSRRVTPKESHGGIGRVLVGTELTGCIQPASVRSAEVRKESDSLRGRSRGCVVDQASVQSPHGLTLVPSLYVSEAQ